MIGLPQRQIGSAKDGGGLPQGLELPDRQFGLQDTFEPVPQFSGQLKYSFDPELPVRSANTEDSVFIPDDCLADTTIAVGHSERRISLPAMMCRRRAYSAGEVGVVRSSPGSANG